MLLCCLFQVGSGALRIGSSEMQTPAMRGGAGSTVCGASLEHQAHGLCLLCVFCDAGVGPALHQNPCVLVLLRRSLGTGRARSTTVQA